MTMSSGEDFEVHATGFSGQRFWQLLRKEWQDHFSQLNAYVVMTVFLAIVGYSFTTVLFFQRSVSVTHAVSQAANLMILIIPLLTMRQFSKERDSGTLELLYSCGCSELELFAAKLLALTALVTVMIVLCLSYPLALAALGHPDFGLVASSYLGLWMMSVSLVALGLCVASFVATPLVAALVSLGLFVGLWMVDVASYLLPASLQAAATHLSLDTHLSRFLMGAIYLSDLTFFMLIIVFSLILGVARCSVR